MLAPDRKRSANGEGSGAGRVPPEHGVGIYHAPASRTGGNGHSFGSPRVNKRQHRGNGGDAGQYLSPSDRIAMLLDFSRRGLIPADAAVRLIMAVPCT